MRTKGVPENGGWRHPWPWFLKRGLGLFFAGFGLAWVGGWLGALWVPVVAFGLGITGMWMLAIASGEVRRVQRAAWWGWYRTAYERNVQAADRGATAESSAPERPDDR